MPKMKTNRGAAKRIKLTKTGKVKRSKCNSRHLLTGKSPKRKRNLKKSTSATLTESKTLKTICPYL